MWSKKKSIILSMIMTGMIFIFIIVAAAVLPRILSLLSDVTGSMHYTNYLIPLYSSVIPGLVCSAGLFTLLINIFKNEVFVLKNVALLRLLSWCCILVGILYLILGKGYLSLLALSFAAFFAGLILRVVKNVFEKAIEIREENDFTI